MVAESPNSKGSTDQDTASQKEPMQVYANKPSITRVASRLGSAVVLYNENLLSEYRYEAECTSDRKKKYVKAVLECR
jgi:hypothetical protein